MLLTSLATRPSGELTTAHPIQRPTQTEIGRSDSTPTATTTQQVLVVPAEDLLIACHREGESRRLNDAEFDYILRNAHWRDRGEAETDESVRQLIPYVAVVSSFATGEILTYTRSRAGTESRLHDLVSIGIGGHVDREDSIEGSFITPREVVDRACRRELREEIGATWHADWQLRRRGLLLSNASPVDLVHVGVTYTLYLTDGEFSFTDTSIQDPEFVPLHRVPYDNLETWSKLYYQSIRYGGLM